ncbi:hypothetical protein [Flavobacterium jumunjinense]|uniref:hypothetical protein n=1 Tax=Flavobacterium jumunjinense TaxID=998845 RepID=UPI0036D3F083
MILKLIILLPLIALFYDGYLKNGIKGGLIYVFSFGLLLFIAGIFLKQFQLKFALSIPVLFLFLIVYNSIQKNK